MPTRRPLPIDPKLLALTTRGKLTYPAGDLWAIRRNLPAQREAAVQAAFSRNGTESWGDTLEGISDAKRMPVSTETREWDFGAGPQPKWFTGTHSQSPDYETLVPRLLREKLLAMLRKR